MLHFLGGLKWHNDEQKISLSLMFDVGPQDPRADSQYEYSLVFKKQLTEKWSMPSSTFLAARRTSALPCPAATPSGTDWIST